MDKRWILNCKRTILALSAALLALAVILLPLPAAAAPRSQDIRMQVYAGYNGTAILSFYNPFRVKLENNGESFSGELQITSGGDQTGRIIHAVAFDLPKGSAKELTVNVPIQTVDKNIEIKIISGKKTIKTETTRLSKIISPQTPVIAVLSDDPNSVTGLSGITMAENLNPALAAMREKMIMSAGGAVVYSEPISSSITSEVIYLDKDTMPSDPALLQGFAAVVISGFDTSVLSDKQADALAAWVSSRGMLFIGTGNTWKRTTAGLPDALKVFAVNGISTITPSSGQLPAAKLDIAVLQTNGGKIVAEERGEPLAVLYPVGHGSVTVLAYDPSTAPLSGWTESQTLWKSIINKSVSLTYPEASSMYQNGYYGPDLGYMADNVPESQTPPYGSLLIIIGVYILIVGPVIYLILKWRDKRDWSWVAIPAAALLFTAVIYGAGFKTRFQTAVINNVSVITLNTRSQTMDISTFSSAFNNTSGTLTIEYPRDLDISVLGNYYGYGFYRSMRESGNRILYKHTDSASPSYEIYDARLWEPRRMKIEKTIPLTGGVVEWAYIRDGRFKAYIDNQTGYRLTNAFIVLGNKYVLIGDILPGEQKDIDLALTDKAVYSDLRQFLNDIFDDSWYSTNSNRPADWRERRRQRDLIDSFIQNSTSNPQYEKMAFCALNESDPGYGLIINGKAPRTYNSNIIYQPLGLQLKKGEKVDIPSGFITPVISNTGNGVEYIRDSYTQGVMFLISQSAEFTFTLPDNIQPEKLRISINGPVMPYGGYPSGTSQKISNSPNKYSYFIFNNTTGQWEMTTEQYELADNLESYIDDGRQIKVRVSAEITESRMNGKSDEMICFPELEISGVVK